MNQQESYFRLSGELIRLGMPAKLSKKISAKLSGQLADFITYYQKGSDMVELMGSLTPFQMSTAVAKRISAAYPKYGPTDQGVMNVALRVATANPTWTEDQVYAETEKSVKPASAGGLLVVPKVLQDRKAQTLATVAVAAGSLLAIGFLTRKRATVD
jgi:hypothetical protein